MTKLDHILIHHRWSGCCDTYPNCDILKRELEKAKRDTKPTKNKSTAKKGQP